MSFSSQSFSSGDSHVRYSHSRLRRALYFLVFCTLLVSALAFRFHNVTEVLVSGRIYFVDADCYSRMSRAQLVSQNLGQPIRAQNFENWPYGVVSHATAPMDYAIVGLERCVRLLWPREGRLAVLRSSTLDLAGALISPISGVFLCAFLWCWARTLTEADGSRASAWWTIPVLAALSPPLVHATVFGRPDHQALLVLLLAVALCSEQRMQRVASRAWAFFGGAAWGGALWVSLYEPLVLLGAVLCMGMLFWRDSWRLRIRLLWVSGLFLLLLPAWWVDAIRIVSPDPQWREALMQWGATIGELQSLKDLAVLSRWTGLLLWVFPVALIKQEQGIRNALGWVFLMLLGAALTCWQIRWAPYFVLTFLCCLPLMLSYLRAHYLPCPDKLLRPPMLAPATSPLLAALVFLASLSPLYSEWSSLLNPDAKTSEQRYLDRSERLNARLAAERMQSNECLPFLAAWWLSPSLAYWSGQPAVAGSSHEGISGIVDSARFLLAEDALEAREILQRRGVRLVVASDSARAVENSAAVLLRNAPAKAVAEKLWESRLDPALGLEGESNVTTFRLLRVR